MSTILDRLLAEGDPGPVTYADLEQTLRLAGYALVSYEGAYRTWKHSSYRGLLTIRDNGGQAMFSQYVRKAQAHLRKVRDHGGF